MNKTDMVEQIVRVPRRFRILGNASMFSLVEATGYFRFHGQISEADIRGALFLGMPHCIRGVFMISSSMPKANEPQVGGLSPKMMRAATKQPVLSTACARTNRMQYDNAIGACASFIKHELESIRLG
jgi:hypothetical protein